MVSDFFALGLENTQNTIKRTSKVETIRGFSMLQTVPQESNNAIGSEDPATSRIIHFDNG